MTRIFFKLKNYDINKPMKKLKNNPSNSIDYKIHI